MFNIRSLTVGIVATNCYLVWNKATREGVLIDPGAEGKVRCTALCLQGGEGNAGKSPVEPFRYG